MKLWIAFQLVLIWACTLIVVGIWFAAQMVFESPLREEVSWHAKA